MAPAEPPAYFPPLDQCLEQGAQLFSWADIFSAIVDDHVHPDEAVTRFLRDPDTLRALRNAYNELPTPTSASRADFVHKTSAINVIPSPNGDYDLAEVKEDTLWLSKEARIEELLAFRTVILELSSRPIIRLWSEASLSEDSSLAERQSNGVNGQTSQVNKKSDDATTRNERQQTLLQLFLRERQYLSAVAQLVVSIALHSACFETTAGRPQRANSKPSVIEGCGNDILRAWELDNKSPQRHVVLSAVDFLESRLDYLGQPADWLQDDQGSEGLEVLRCQTLLTEIVHAQQTVFTLLDWDPETPSAEIMDSWFGLMGKCQFLNFLHTASHPATSQLTEVAQSLTAVITLAIIKLPNLAQALSQVADKSAPSDDSTGPSTAYFRNVACVARTTACLLQAVEDVTPTVGPAALAWSIAFQDIADYSNGRKETREARQHQQVVDRAEAERQTDISGGRQASPSRRSSVSSETSQPLSLFEEVTNAISNLRPNDQLLRTLAFDSVNKLGALDVIKILSEGFCTDASPDYDGRLGLRIRLLFLQLLRHTQDVLGYQTSTFECYLTILNGRDDFWTRHDRTSQVSSLEPARAFLDDLACFKTRVWTHALQRFPYETLPALSLCQALCLPSQDVHKALEDSLKNLQVFATVLNEKENPVDPYNDNDMIVVLRHETNAMDLHLPFLRLIRSRSLDAVPSDLAGSMGKFTLHAGTQGQIITDGRPTVVAWQLPSSANDFFGIILRLAYEQRSSRRSGETAQIFATATEIIGVLAALTSRNVAEGHELDSTVYEFVFQSTSQDFCEYQDVVSLIFELFESQLFRDSQTFNDQVASDFLTNSIRLLHSLLHKAPHRVWPFLGRSSLLGMHGNESRLLSAISMLELPNGRHGLLMSSIRLFEGLIRDAVTHSSIRQVEDEALTRFRPAIAASQGPGTLEATIQLVILSFTKILIDVFETSRSWKFSVVDDRLDINRRVCDIFDNILNTYFGLDDAEDGSPKLTACLAPAANCLVELFLAHKSSGLATKALLDVILDGLATPINTIAVRRWMMWQSQTVAALTFTSRLVRLSRFLSRSSSLLEREFFKKGVPLLMQLYAGFPKYRSSVVDLLNAVVHSEGVNGEQPPSLLSSIGQGHMAAFVDVLSCFDRPFQRPALAQAIWKLLAIAISHRQQWFTVYLLTGTTPRQLLQKQKVPAKTLGSRPMFQLALERFMRIQTVARDEALGVLEFIAAAIDYSPGAMEQLKNGTKDRGLESTLQLVADLKPPSSTDPNVSGGIPQSYQLAALIVKILAMLEHHHNERYAGQQGRPTLFHNLGNKQVQKLMKFLLEHGVEVPSYIGPLHMRLQKNLQDQIPKCKVTRFKRTTLNPSHLGPDFYYDIGAFNSMLKKDPKWTPTFSRAMTEELARANLNLSIVEAQVELFRSWKLLIGELNEEAHGQAFTHDYYISIIRSCLHANTKRPSADAGREPYLEELAFDRVDIALLLAQRLARQATDDEKVLGVLHLAWATLSEYSTDLGASLASEGAEYARKLLKLLCLLIGASAAVVSKREAHRRKKDEDDVDLILKILEGIGSLAFRSLVRAVHDDQSKVDPADFALINALLRSCLSFPGIERHPDRLNEIFVDQGALRSASTLLSWADKLAIDGDPVYGEVSTTYVLELSKLAALAESILLDGVLAATLMARLLGYLRRPGGIGPFQEPARMHAIWTRGLLPLLVNLLSLVGAPAAAEVAQFLAFFEPQLARASGSFDLRGPSAVAAPVPPAAVAGVTLALTAEAQSLALIAAVLDRYREAGASAGIDPADVPDLPWDRAAVRLDLEGLLERRHLLRDSLVPLGEREQEWARAKPEGADKDVKSKYEEMVVKDMGLILFLLGGDE